MSRTPHSLDPQQVVKVDDIETVIYRTPSGALQGLKFSGGQGTVEKVEKVPFRKPEVYAARKHLHREMQSEAVDFTMNYATAELQLLRTVSGQHHMPRFLGAAEAQGLLYMFYEPWCKCNLKEWLRNPTIMGHHSNAVVRHCGIQYMMCMSAALHNLHSLAHPIIHRDLKPENILIDDENNLCFVDFGVGKLCTSSTVSKSYIGTETYMAPEILHRKPHSRPAEVFSLGSIFVEILTVMSGTQVHAVHVFRRNRPFAERPQKTMAWMDGLMRLDASLAPYIAIVKDMLDLRPLNRPAFWEIHERVRQAGLAEGLTFVCCEKELPEEEEAGYSDGTEAIESASSDDANELIKKLRLPLA